MTTIWNVYDDLYGAERPFIGPMRAPKPDPIGVNQFHDAVRNSLADHGRTAVLIARDLDISTGAVRRVLDLLVWNGEAEMTTGKLTTFRRAS